MTDLAFGLTYMFVAGALVGAWAAIGLLWYFGAFERKQVLTHTTEINVDWSLIDAAVQGEGYMLVAKPQELRQGRTH